MSRPLGQAHVARDNAVVAVCDCERGIHLPHRAVCRLSLGMTRLLKARGVAERLGVTTTWVWAQTRAGQIPHAQLGRYRRFREEAIEQWLAQLEQNSVKS